MGKREGDRREKSKDDRMPECLIAIQKNAGMGTMTRYASLLPRGIALKKKTNVVALGVGGKEVWPVHF